ncbi:MAG: DUF3224 domain-containing protein [Ardenticatenaceae bacterium]|nr:DUF3224 domain-containing protein [Anaerolineales bacterium]MCB8921547.1 DUF3224 domain-containing protein [Ardenticatenaceae bacterium]MCB8991464.1 DUF3224 domain-containing protein [Ardenticatenaceae bacterium]MCB9003916.1 DUF3224 domain-containing protein [Ardenticatenaceae bacterium]
MKVEGQFQVTSWNEVTHQAFAAEGKINRAVVEQTYSGGLSGKSVVEYIMCYPNPTSATFVGVEIFEGTVDGKTGTWVFVHKGKFENGIATSSFSTLNSDGELQGLVAEGHFETIDHQTAVYKIDVLGADKD